MHFINNSIRFYIKELCKLIILSFSTGIFPDCLKTAVISPIFKQGDTHLFTNYRPISLLPQISKIVEKCFEVRLLSFLTKHNILVNEQYGFRKNISTEMAIVDFIENIVAKISKKNYVAAVTLDFKKAFDCVNRKMLLQKLEIWKQRNSSPVDYKLLH